MNNAYSVGKRVFLRALVEQDAEGPWHEWFSDEEVTKWTQHWQPNSIVKQQEFFHSQVEKSPDLILGVFRNDGGQHIGVVSLRKINWVHGFADIALIIGDRAAREQAVLGIEAFTMMIRIGFLRLNLRNIKGSYIDGQDQSKLILRCLGFKEVGRLHGLYEIEGCRKDSVLVQLQKQDWLSRNFGALPGGAR